MSTALAAAYMQIANSNRLHLINISTTHRHGGGGDNRREKNAKARKKESNSKSGKLTLRGREIPFRLSSHNVSTLCNILNSVSQKSLRGSESRRLVVLSCHNAKRVLNWL